MRGDWILIATVLETLLGRLKLQWQSGVSKGGAFVINDFHGWLTRVLTVERHFSSGWIGG